jgi:hypothetical protein
LLPCLYCFAPAAAGGLSVLRTFRLLRILKLARNWKELQRILNSIIKSVASVCWLSLLLLLFMFVFALMGMQLFGWQMAQCDVAGAQQLCPPGLDNHKECPYHYDCYVPCDSSRVGQWFPVTGESSASIRCACKVWTITQMHLAS